jgi:hypothetical protein
MARTWIEEIVLPRRHRTTKQVIADAWSQERPLLAPLPGRLLQPTRDLLTASPLPPVIDLAVRRLGDQVETRDLTEYEVAM